MRTRIQAEQSLRAYTRRHRKETVTAVLGTNAGVVDHPTRGSNWVYARLRGDRNQIITALEEGTVDHTAGLLVELELVGKTAGSYYRVLGLATSATYPGNPWGATVRPHGWTHERKDGNTGGNDPVNVYARMVVPLRARAQATPNMTLYVEAGYSPLTGNYFAGGSSPVVTAPVSQARVDLLYLASDDTLKWATGTPDSSPSYPPLVVPCVPLAMVWTHSATTTLQESNLIRDPSILRSAVGAVTASNAEILVDDNGDILMDDTPDILYQET
jgi:hypothetical protein